MYMISLRTVPLKMRFDSKTFFFVKVTKLHSVLLGIKDTCFLNHDKNI